MNKLQSTLTRKVGPLPAWAWLGLAVAAWFLFFHNSGAKASGGTQLPYTPKQGSAAQQPASGQGGADENGNADLLAALGQNSDAYDALLAALQYGGGGGGYGSGGIGSTAGVPAATAPSTGGAVNGETSTEAVTAPTITTTENNAPVFQPSGTYVGDAIVQTSVGPVSYSGYTQDPAYVDASGGYVNGIIPAATYTIGQGGSVDPILESMTVPTHYNTPAYSPNPDNTQNALAYATKTHQAVAI